MSAEAARGVLFIGPSLASHEARAVFPGDVRPPAKRGDLDELLALPELPRCVGIVDGQFLHALAISPKEVLRLVDRGVVVFGASSMGALRAVECGPFGMIGIGRIFRMYLTGELDADDEVAITFDPDSLQALSEPMVNIRVAIEAAVQAGVLPAATGGQVAAVAKALYFPNRRYPMILQAVRGEIGESERIALADFLSTSEVPDQKRTDALELIEGMRVVLAADEESSGRSDESIRRERDATGGAADGSQAATSS